MKAGRDILGDYGPNSPNPQRAPATTGGVKQARDVMNYCPPQGPKNIGDPKGPGLHGHNCGNTNRPMAAGGQSGRPGLGGDSPRGKGSQR